MNIVYRKIILPLGDVWSAFALLIRKVTGLEKWIEKKGTGFFSALTVLIKKNQNVKE
jgi:hypothetical protein